MHADDKYVVEFVLLGPEWEAPLADFFDVLENNGDSFFFHPHAFSPGEAQKRAHYSGKDLYYVATANTKVIGYGMLRGWDAGYEIPSLGIAIHPQWRGRKIGRAMMEFMHAAARTRGAKQIRLKVYKANSVAKDLYMALGYRFVEEQESEIIGYCDLVKTS